MVRSSRYKDILMKNHTSPGSAFALLGLLLFFFSCEKEVSIVTPKALSLLSVQVGGQALTDGAINIPLHAAIELTFSGALDPARFEAALSLSGPDKPLSFTVAYANAGSKAILSLQGLDYDLRYTLRLSTQPIGKQGEALSTALNIGFSTLARGPVTAMAPCATATAPCSQRLTLHTQNGARGYLHFYGTYPLYEENTRWANLKYAVIVLHGQNRDADAYFDYLLSALRRQNLLDSTILLSPFFKADTDAGASDLYWSNTAWRSGLPATGADNSSNPLNLLDSLVNRLANKDRFPALRSILITGHSSGALLAQLYALANRAENTHGSLRFHYAVANTQYYYYPDERRVNENTGVLYVPANCPAYQDWPLGYRSPAPYLSGVAKTTVDRQLGERSITYVLGNGTAADPTLNTSDCEATLLGSTRYKRGENYFLHLQNTYGQNLKSQKIIVQGVSHDGLGVYASPEFQVYLRSVLK